MNIGELAKESGVNAKLIRHYEEIGLVPKVARTDKGYRIYLDSDVHYLRFIKRARELGFSLQDIKKLLSLWKNKTRSSGQVKTLAQKHLEDYPSCEAFFLYRGKEKLKKGNILCMPVEEFLLNQF